MPANENIRRGENIFRQLYDGYKNRLYGYILTIVHVGDAAEEITQEVFIKIWMRRDKLNDLINPENYIFTIARNKTLNYLRKAANDKRLLGELQSRMKQEANNVEEQIQFSEHQKLIEEALSQLSPQRSLVFRLSRYQGLDHEEIAQKLHLSKNTIKNHLVAALGFIRAYLVRHDVTLLLLILLFFY
jgi:RNA polymerase sigma-70 factor (ECF subfamily)